MAGDGTQILSLWYVSRFNLNSAYTQPTHLIFGIVKDHHLPLVIDNRLSITVPKSKCVGYA